MYSFQNIYYSFNLLIRRDPKTNNFKAVLATIRQLLNTEFVVPDWLHDLILGYGEPNAAHYKSYFFLNNLHHKLCLYVWKISGKNECV